MTFIETDMRQHVHLSVYLYNHMYFLKHKGAVCKNLSPSEFILRTNRLQYITRVITNCSCHKLGSSVSNAASLPINLLQPDWELSAAVVYYQKEASRF